MPSPRLACLLVLVLPSLVLADDYGDGVSLLSTGKYTEAIAAFGKMISRDKNHVHSYANRGLAYFERGEKGDLDKAIADFEKVIDLAKNDKQMLRRAYYDKALAYYHWGHNWHLQAVAHHKKKEFEPAQKDYSLADAAFTVALAT